MYSTSDSFKSIIKSDKRTFALRVTLNSSTELTGTTIQDVTLDEVINSAETLTMGCACSNKVTINLINPPTDIDYENMTIKVENNEYKLIKNYKDGFDEENFKERYTSYFENYDYIVGDIAYSKLRLKGFNKKENKNCNKINNYKNVELYIKNNCAYDCKYFILEKIEKK
jgi:uncharacterized protein YutD